MKRVLFIQHPFTDKYIKLLPADVEVHVILNKKNTNINYSDSITLHRLTYVSDGLQKLLKFFRLETHLPMKIWTLNKTLKNIKPDIIFTSDIYHDITKQSIRYAEKHNCICYSFTETKHWPKSKISSWYLKSCLSWLNKKHQSVAGFIAYTNAGQNFMTQQMPQIKTHLVPALINLDLFAKKPSARSAGEPLRLLMNARYVLYKRHEDLFQALKMCLDDNLSVELTCIGRAGDLLPKLEARVSELGLDGTVKFIDAVEPDQLPDIYSQHHALVLPSQNEAIGLAVPEAMACGLPTITSDTVGANVYVHPEKTGIIFSTSNIKQLASSIKTMTDETRRWEMARSAHSHMHQSFTQAKLAGVMEQILNR